MFSSKVSEVVARWKACSATLQCSNATPPQLTVRDKRQVPLNDKAGGVEVHRGCRHRRPAVGKGFAQIDFMKCGLAVGIINQAERVREDASLAEGHRGT